MNESDTRLHKIDPQLKAAGWGVLDGSRITTEYTFTKGKISQTMKGMPKRADYVLIYKGVKLAVIEAKSDELSYAEGVAQAKEYADMLSIRFTYATNGNQIWEIDRQTQEEHFVEAYPSPEELWKRTYGDVDEWRDKFNAQPYYDNGVKQPRYYQETAVRKVLEGIAKGEKRILLTLATGTGKTFIAFQIAYKLFETRWNLRKTNTRPKILFLADRNVLANQAKNDFGGFKEDAMVRIKPGSVAKNGQVPTNGSVFFTIFQTFMCGPDDSPYFGQYPKDFFDLIIIDECHRGGANDESEWRKLMEYFDSAYQLGMTATPRRKDNANTYAYFGNPVYSYSLKQGIEDGFLVPFRVEVSTSNIDDYQYREGDIVKSGDIDYEKIYSESDFYNGRIQIKERDEHRVQEFLNKIDPDEKTIVFCATQKHAMIVRDMVNKHKQRPASNYCERVTADDGEVGEATLRAFQDNEKMLPTILTTSYKLSTGVDARNVRNIVLMRPIQNMVEFKQIIGRGTRLFDKKYYFTIYDFVGASEMFKDPDWDGDTYCPVCGNWPCTCMKKVPGAVPEEGEGDKAGEPLVCPVCGNLPCTCEGPKTNTVEVKLSTGRKLSLETTWEQKLFYGDELISLDDYVKKLFGRIPEFFSDADDLREKWSNPETREDLLKTLDEAGFAEDKLNLLRNMLKMQKCDLLDVLEYIAYNSTPIERAKRVELVKKQYVDALNKEQREFDDLILEYYASNGFKELGTDKLKTFINIKFNSMRDAKERLQMSVADIRNHYFELQRRLYLLA